MSDEAMRPAAARNRSSLLWVEGADAVIYLDSLLSQNIAGMDQGSVAPSLLLAPNGKMRATLTVLKGAGRVGEAGSVESRTARTAHQGPNSGWTSSPNRLGAPTLPYLTAPKFRATTARIGAPSGVSITRSVS